MDEKTGTRNWRNWIPPITLAVVAIAAVLAIQNANGKGLDFFDSASDFARNLYYFSYSLLLNGCSAILVIALMFHLRRCLPLAWFALALLALRVIAEALYHFSGTAITTEPKGILYESAIETSIACTTVTIILLILLPRLGKTGRKFQIVAVASIVAVLACHYLMTFRMVSPLNLPFLVIRVLAGVACVASVAWIAYLTCFHVKPATHDPPMDAAGVVQLTCPRCQSAQQIRTDGGRCTNCRLDIFIALKEGSCRKCHYPLRGLTSTVCPECGTPVAPTSP